MPTLIVTAVHSGTGKTAVASGITALLRQRGHKAFAARAMGAGAAIAADTHSFARVFPDGPALVLSGTAGAADFRQVASRISETARHGHIAIIEASSGDTASTLALAEATDGLIILVSRHDEDIVQAAHAYRSRLAGVIINAVPRYRWDHVETVTVPALKTAGIPYLGAIPEDRRLLAPSVDLIADHLGGSFSLLPENGDRLVDNFLIGGLVLDWGPTYFGSKENTCVVVRGDRPDVQLAALQTDTTRAMVVTKGIVPIEYVQYEAGQRGIPIVVSPFNTHETTTKLESLLTSVRFDHPEKLARMLELVTARLDIPVIERAVAQPATR